MGATMKKLTMFAIIPLLSLGGCKEKPSAEPSAEVSAKAPENAAEAISAIQAQGLKLQDVVVLDEKTDTNNLLGRPGQYTSKVFFHDVRHPKTPESGDEFEATLEMFPSPKEAKARHDYIAEMTAGMPVLLQYQFLRGNTLLRLPKAFTPSETKDYEQALAKVVPEQ